MKNLFCCSRSESPKSRFPQKILLITICGLLPFVWRVWAEEAVWNDQPRYAVLAKQKTAQDPAWRKVIDALLQKRHARLFVWKGHEVEALRPKLVQYHPFYICIVARPQELAAPAWARIRSPKGQTLQVPLQGVAYRLFGVLMRSLDPDPYDDALWGIVTGADATDALRMVSAPPLTIRRGLSHIGRGWLEWLESGVSFDEGHQGRKWIRVAGQLSKEVKGPSDTTVQFIQELNSGKIDMVSTSGHATEHDWQMGYTYRSGQIVTRTRLKQTGKGLHWSQKRIDWYFQGGNRLVGVDRQNHVYPITTDNPKIYYSPGNCRIGRVSGPDCMVLGWIHHGAYQFFGHVGLQLHSCYAWGVVDYFLRLQGRFSFAEAVWLNQQALRWERSRMTKEERRTRYLCCADETAIPAEGQLFWETTAFYGDPAWEARVKPITQPLYNQHMKIEPLPDGTRKIVFTVQMQQARKPARPAAFLFHHPLGKLKKVIKGPKDLVLTENFALIPFWENLKITPHVGQRFSAEVIVEPEKQDQGKKS